MNIKNTDTNLKNFGKKNLTNLIALICFASFCSLKTLPAKAVQINFDREFASKTGQDTAELILQLQQDSLDRYSKSKETQSHENKNRDNQNQDSLASKNSIANLQNFGGDSGISLSTILPVGAMVSLCLQAHASDKEDNSDSNDSSLLCYMPLLFTLADMLRDSSTDKKLPSNEYSSPKEKIDNIPIEKKVVPEPLSVIGTAVAGITGCLMKRKYHNYKVKA